MRKGWAMHDPVPAMPSYIPQPALRRLQLRMRRVLRAPGREYAPRQSPCSGDAGSDSPVQGQPAQVRDRWFAERAHLGARLSESELAHGVAMGVISSALLEE